MESCIASFVLEQVLGYTIHPSVKQVLHDPSSYVVIFPHTSLCEVIIAMLAVTAVEGRSTFRFFCTEQYTSMCILGPILQYFGSISVPLAPPSNDGSPEKVFRLTDFAVEFLKHHSGQKIAISPEGYLSPKPWKSGFFHIAREANVPILIAGIDFDAHTVRYFPERVMKINKTDEFEDACPLIMDEFAKCGLTPLHPENSNPRIIGSETKYPCLIPNKRMYFLKLLVLCAVIYFASFVLL